MQIVMDKAQDLVKAFTRIADDFANLELGKATLKRLETWDGLKMVVAIGGDEGAGQDPIGKESVIQDVEGFGLVAKVMFAPAVGRSGCRVWGGDGALRRWGIRAAVKDIGGLAILSTGQAAVVGTRVGVACATVFAFSAGGARALVTG